MEGTDVGSDVYPLSTMRTVTGQITTRAPSPNRLVRHAGRRALEPALGAWHCVAVLQ